MYTATLSAFKLASIPSIVFLLACAYTTSTGDASEFNNRSAPVPPQIPFPTPSKQTTSADSPKEYLATGEEFAIALNLAGYKTALTSTDNTKLFEAYWTTYTTEASLDSLSPNAIGFKGFVINTRPDHLNRLALGQLIEINTRYIGGERSDQLVASAKPDDLQDAQLACALFTAALTESGLGGKHRPSVPCNDLFVSFTERSDPHSADTFISFVRGELGLGSRENNTNPTKASITENLPSDLIIEMYQGENQLGGNDINLSEIIHKGLPVVLNFWAGLCPPCRAEMPHLQYSHERYSGELSIIGVDVGPHTVLGSIQDGLNLISEMDISFPTGSTPDPSALSHYQLEGTPSTLFILPSGEVLRRWTGAITKARLEEQIRRLIRVSASFGVD